ncbi:MAG: hypothetical protein ACO3D5_07250, partial [Ilumatobacteraceae bacterium]
GFAPWMKVNLVLYESLGPASFRFLTFLFFFCAGICLYGISLKFGFLSLYQRRVVTLLFLVLPFNTSRVALIVFHYSEAYFLFFLGWLLLVTFNSLRVKFVCLLIFFLSFQMHSMIFFYLLPIAHLFLNSKIRNIEDFFRWQIKNLVFLLLPFIYWILRFLYWPEKVQYHNVSIGAIGDSLVFLACAITTCLIIFWLLRKTDLNFRSSITMIYFGVLTLIIALYPYVLYGFFKSDSSLPLSYLSTLIGRTSWYTRHQTLQPLPVSLFIVGTINLFEVRFRREFQTLYRSVLFACLVFNIGFGFEHVVDYSKQKQIIAQLKLSDRNQSKNLYQFIDQTTGINARGQTMYTPGWSGLIGIAYGSSEAGRIQINTNCKSFENARLVLIQGPGTHWEALKNWVSDGDMGFEVTVDDTPGACKPEMVTSEKVSGAIPILFYFTGAKG